MALNNNVGNHVITNGEAVHDVHDNEELSDDSLETFLFSSESVGEGHPGKFVRASQLLGTGFSASITGASLVFLPKLRFYSEGTLIFLRSSAFEVPERLGGRAFSPARC